MPKITAAPKTQVIKAKTRDETAKVPSFSKWWSAQSELKRGQELVSTALFLKDNQQYRQRQVGIYARLYGNMPLFNFIGTNLSQISTQSGLPTDRPTFNIIQSGVDTLLSKITQVRPQPVFLTDGGNYRERNLAKQLNNFILGEFHQTKTYELACDVLRDALVLGTGIFKVYRTQDDKVGLERILASELLVDPSESIYGNPRQLYQLKLIDRGVLKDWLPDSKTTIDKAETAYVTETKDPSSVSDLVLVVEGWHLPSGEDAKDGRHTIACSAGTILDEPYDKSKFPFVFLHNSSRLLGFWGAGIAEQQMGTQLEINSLLYTISRSMRLVGVPRVFVEDGSVVVKAQLNSEIGSIVTYRGTKPIYEVAPCVPQELYQQLERLIQYGYQQMGVSALQAGAQKPAGLNSGEAIRTYDDISTDRFAALARKYDNLFVDLAYLMIDVAKDIAEDTGSYQTVYPGKDGTRSIDLPSMSILKNPFVIQAFNISSLPRDPAGRLQKITEMIQGGMVSIKEGRRLLNFPDIEQMDKLANASEERIYYMLDSIVDENMGLDDDEDDDEMTKTKRKKSSDDDEDSELPDYMPPDPFLDLDLAEEIAIQYYNLYVPAKLEEEKCNLLRTWITQVQSLKTARDQAAQNAAMQAAQMQAATQGPPGASNPPQAQPMPLPNSPLVPNAVTS